jgi:hypothetical protein
MNVPPLQLEDIRDAICHRSTAAIIDLTGVCRDFSVGWLENISRLALPVQQLRLGNE